MAQQTLNDGESGLIIRGKINDNFTEVYAGAGSVPGGSTTQVQYNNAGAFAGNAGLTTDGTSLTIATGTITASAPALNATQTWNNGAVIFTGWKLNVTNAASASGSLLADFQVGGASAFSVKNNGMLIIGPRTTSGVAWRIGTATEAGNVLGIVARLGDDSGYASVHGSRITASSGLIGPWSGADWAGWTIFADSLVARNNGAIEWSNSGSSSLSGAVDLTLRRSAAATLQQGAANAASPVAQTLQAQGSRSGSDTNVGGANYTIRAGAGTGTGAISSLILQSPIAVAAGTGAQTQTTGATIKNGTLILPAYAFASLPASPDTYARCFVTDSNQTLTAGIGTTCAAGGANKVPVFYDGTNWIIG